MNRELKYFVRDFVEFQEGLADVGSDDILRVVWPSFTAARLQRKEYEVFSFSQQPTASSEFIGYGSPFLEQLSPFFENAGRCGGILLQIQPKHVPEDLVQDVSKNFVLLNAIGKVKQTWQQTVCYLLCNFKFSAVSDEKFEGILPVAINMETMTLAEGLDERLDMVAFKETSESAPSPNIEEAYRCLKGVVGEKVRHEVKNFEDRMNHRFRRDVQRLKNYYGTLIQESHGRLERKNLNEALREKEVSRISAMELELKTKILDQKEKYSIRLTSDIVNIMRIFMPVSLIEYELQRRKNKKTVLLCWNPLIKNLEHLLCQSCFKPALQFFICDDELHFICKTCFSPCVSCQKVYCKRCYLGGCSRCRRQ